MGWGDGECSKNGWGYVEGGGEWREVWWVGWRKGGMMVEMCRRICMKGEKGGDMVMVEECDKMGCRVVEDSMME